MGFKFPYGNQQQLNLNWFIKKFKELLVDWKREKESIDGALDAEIQRAEDALSDVYAARDTTVAAKNDALQAKADALTAAANAAQYWQNAAASANSAATSAVTALQAAQDAADDAEQTDRDRALVSADKAAVAADKATVASDKATVAADKETVAADKDAVAQDKDDVDTMKDAANAAALRSEGWADGTQNGTPVASGSPYFENNAKYYAQQAAGTSGELAQAMIADKENTTATAAHEAGDYFRIAGILYKATASIAIGATITENVNCEKVVLANELASGNLSGDFIEPSMFYTKQCVHDFYYHVNSRSLELKGNKVVARRYASGSTLRFFIVTKENPRDAGTSLENIVLNLDELLPIPANLTIKYFVTNCPSTTVGYRGLGIIPCSVDANNNITQLSAIDTSFPSGTYGFYKYGATQNIFPAGATHYAIFLRSYPASYDYYFILDSK